MNAPLIQLMRAIASGDGQTASALLADTPQLAMTRLERRAPRATSEEFFLDELKANVYTGDTALHVATSRPRHRCHRESAAR